MRLEQVMDFFMEQNRWGEIMPFLQANDLMDSNHVKVILALTQIYRARGELEKARKVIERGLQKHAYNADVHMQAGLVYADLGIYQTALHHLFLAQRLDSEKKTNQLVLATMVLAQKHVTEEEFEALYMHTVYLANNLYENFPLAGIEGEEKEKEWSSYIGGSFSILDQDYWVGKYTRNAFISYPMPVQYPVEVLIGEKTDVFQMTCEEETILPLMLLEADRIKLRHNEERLEVDGLDTEKFHYYTIPKGTKLKVQTENQKNFVVGKPIVNHNAADDKPRLILNIYIDDLSQLFLDTFGLENVMPNTARFFQKGTICTRAYVSAEWTHPSMASYATGLYTMGHRLIHPTYNTDAMYTLPLYAEVFQKMGYFCTSITGSARSTPIHGYAKGMDRSVYQKNYYGMDTGQVIEEIMEQLYAFPKQKHFIDAYLHDLHAIPKGEDNRPSTDIRTPLKFRLKEIENVKSVDLGYQEFRVAQCHAMLQRMDMLLGNLYAYVEANYQEDEYILSIVSDHGTSYVSGSHQFDDKRLHIPMLFRGRNIPVGQCTELMQGLDLYPILLHSIGENSAPFPNDGNVPVYFGGEKAREYAFSESIYPGKQYFAGFYEQKRKFFFYLTECCTNDGRLPYADFNTKAVDLETGEEITMSCTDDIKQYQQKLYHYLQDYFM